MKVYSTPNRASHVNTGTSVARDELPWPETDARVMRGPKLHIEVEQESIVTAYGGLHLVMQFARRFKLAEKIDTRVQVFKYHLPYHESDHVMAQAMNLYVGGDCIEDMANLQHSEGVLRMTGACRLPDPTTGGDFLRRFDEDVNPGALRGLRAAVDEVQKEVWRAAKRRMGRSGNRQEWALVDIDSHVKEFYSEQKEEADFSYNGRWSYHPLMLSLANTGECLAVMNRPGNAHSNQGAGELLDGTLSRMTPHFGKILVRGDSAFDILEMRQACEKHGARFAFVCKAYKNRPGIAYKLPRSAWRPFETRVRRERGKIERRRAYRARDKRKSLRDRIARRRGYQQMRLHRQWIAEVPWTPTGSKNTYRLVIRKQIVKHTKGQQALFDDERYLYVVTNLPKSVGPEQVVDLTYARCDQENVIEQMKNGLASWRMPVREFAGNSAWLEIARLAWNLAKWIAQLALPPEVLRWKWKRFRQAFVLAAATVIKRARQIWVRLSDSHRFTNSLVAAHQRLQT